MILAFEIKTFSRESGLFQKVMTYKLCQNANFKNGGTTIQMGILHRLLNMLPISLLSRLLSMTRLAFSRCIKCSLHFEEN